MPQHRSPEEYLKIMSDIAKANGGKLLSDKWEGSTKKHRFAFASGLEFEILFRNLVRGWPKDEHIYFKISNRTLKVNQDKIEELEKILNEYGHQILSRDWKGRDTGLDVMLSNKEIVTLSPRKILKREFFTKRERGLVTEPIFRQAFEHLFGFKFKNTKQILKTVINNRKRTLELDGYCHELKLAFEYQGHQAHWKKEHPRYQATYKIDKVKMVLCNDLDILLIQIPAIKETTDKWASEKIINQTIKLIKASYKKANRVLPYLNLSKFDIDFSKINHSKEMIQKLNDFCISNNGKLLSNKWLGMTTQHLFEYSPNVKFKTTPTRLYKKGWPTDIEKFIIYSEGHSKTKPQLIKALAAKAKLCGFTLLSNEWISNKFRYSFLNQENEEVLLTAEYIHNLAKKKADHH